MMIRIDYALVPAVLMIVIAACSFGFMKLEKQIPAWKPPRRPKPKPPRLKTPETEMIDL